MAKRRQTRKQRPSGIVAYYRLSKAGKKSKGKGGLGLDAQRAIVGHYYPDLIAEYQEIVSGKSVANRNELEKAIKLCQRGNHTLVVAKVDRLGRDTEDNLRIYRRLNGRLACCDVPVMGGDPGAFKMQLTFLSAFAERERELISIRTKAALAAAKRNGTKIGSPENLTDESRARSITVRRAAAKEAYRQQYNYIKTLRDGGLSYEHIARQLNEDGYETRNDKPFQAMTIYRILQRGNGE